MLDKQLLKTLTILYVEDDHSIRTSMNNILQAIVKDVVLAVDGEDGLEKFKNNKNIDIIVTDINMPKMDGLTMCDHLRQIDKNIPIIVTTAYNDNNFLSHAIEVGINSYLMKPVDAYKLIEAFMKVAEPLFLRRELEIANKELEKRVSTEIEQNLQKDILIQEIVEFQKNMLVVVDNTGKPLFANKSFMKLLHVNDFEELLEKHSDLSSIFVENEEYFYPEHYDNGKLWMENISVLEANQRIVMLLDLQTFLPKTYLVNIHFNESSSHWICTFSEFTQIAIEKKMFKDKAYTDDLTQIANRAKFNLDYENCLERLHTIPNVTCSLVMFDIDHFKKLNDKYGHDVGDDVLKKLANLVNMNVRQNDIFARWGGEEFMILLQDTNKENAIKAANHLRKVIDDYIFHDSENVTCSFGVTQLLPEDQGSTAIKRVDKALYESKNNGRNIVTAI